VVVVPDVLIRIHPEWRDYSYFVVDEDIVIIDRDYRIVASVPVGSSGAQLENRGPQFSDRGGATLSVEEIRQVQIALNAQGFDIGEPDGKLGPKTRQALIIFQRQNGLQTTGQIDRQTFTMVTASTSGGQRGNQGQMSTTGQGGASPPANQGAAQPQGSSPSGTTGQSGNAQPPAANQPPANQPSARPQANQQQQGNQPDQSTTGQGGAGPANRGPANTMNPSAQPGNASPQPNSGGTMQGGQSR
jgi:peptidoglycan hydrolase-like protein with peptidoglycan-binding domain